MTFKLDTAPVDAISNETGAPIATGSTYSGTGNQIINLDPVPITEGQVYALTAPVTSSDTPTMIRWDIEVVSGPDSWTEADGYGVDGGQDEWDTATGVGVSIRSWRAPATGTARFRLVLDGPALITAPSAAPYTGRIILTVPGNILAETIMASGGFVAGTPGGARIEIDNAGLRAYDATNTETASIEGGEGVFVGGEFRTSDALPGQVTLADDAWTDSWTGEVKPGIRVDPVDASATVIAPGIGPEGAGIKLDGGSDTDGNRSNVVAAPSAVLMRATAADGSYGVVSADPDASVMETTGAAGAGRVQTTADASQMQTTGAAGGGVVQTAPGFSLMASRRPDGTTASDVQTGLDQAIVRAYAPTGTGRGMVVATPGSADVRTYSGNGEELGWVRANPTDAELAAVSPMNTYISRIRADASEAYLHSVAGGTPRYLSVDADGIWVKVRKDGVWKHYNLEETAQDSGWQAITPASGITGAGSPGWRNKGGVVWMRGQLTLASGSWAAGWTTLCTLPAEASPATALRRPAAIPGTGGAVLQVGSTGVVQVYLPATLTGATEMHLGGLFFPLG